MKILRSVKMNACTYKSVLTQNNNLFNNNGFLLIELLVGLFFMVSMGAVLFSSYAKSAHWQRLATERMHAVDAACSQLELLQLKPDLSSGASGYKLYNFSWQVEPIKTVAGVSDLIFLTTAWRGADGIERTVRLWGARLVKKAIVYE